MKSSSIYLLNVCKQSLAILLVGFIFSCGRKKLIMYLNWLEFIKIANFYTSFIYSHGGLQPYASEFCSKFT